MSGMSGMLATVTEQAMKHLPPDILAQITQIGDTVKVFNTKLDAILRNQALIMAHLNINGDNDDGQPRSDRPERAGTGNGSGGH